MNPVSSKNPGKSKKARKKASKQARKKMLRNLYAEFNRDSRMSPVNKNRRSLAEDWRMSTTLMRYTNHDYSIVIERFGRINLEFVVDGPRGSGRIVYMEIPELQKYGISSRCEVVRGVSLGEAYDYFSDLLTKDKQQELVDLVNMLFAIPDQEHLDRYDEYESRRRSREEIDAVKAKEYRNHLVDTGAHYEFTSCGKEQRQLVLVSAAGQARREKIANDKAEKIHVSDVVKMVQLQIRELIMNDMLDDEAISLMKEVMAETNEEHLFDWALNREYKEMKRQADRIQRQLAIRQDKINDRKK